MNAGGVATISVPTRFTSVPAGGSATNSATVDVDPAKTGGIDTPGGNNTGSHTVPVTSASLAGTVFQDRDRAGANAGTPQAAGVEPRLAGVQVRLTGTDAFGNAIDLSTTTAGRRQLQLHRAAAVGCHRLHRHPDPAGRLCQWPGAAAGGGRSRANGRRQLQRRRCRRQQQLQRRGAHGAPQDATQYNFPEVRQPSLSGFVYVDSNLNGVRDAGTDTAIANATVRLLNAATGALVATATTDGTGAYSFTGLDPSVQYTLEEPLPATHLPDWPMAR